MENEEYESGIQTLDDWFDVNETQVLFDAAIKAGYDDDSINDYFERKRWI
jgi:hypothetical protein